MTFIEIIPLNYKVYISWNQTTDYCKSVAVNSTIRHGRIARIADIKVQMLAPLLLINKFHQSSRNSLSSYLYLSILL